jgi:hypothetical protein
MKLSRLAAAALLLACSLSSAACKTGEPWAFAVTKSVNESGVGAELLESSQGSDQAETVALAVLLAPFAIDIVLLPVTLTHDAVACK